MKNRNATDLSRAQDTWSLLVAFAMLCALVYSIGHESSDLLRPEASVRVPASLPSQSPQAWLAPTTAPASRLTP